MEPPGNSQLTDRSTRPLLRGSICAGHAASPPHVRALHQPRDLGRGIRVPGGPPGGRARLAGGVRAVLFGEPASSFPLVTTPWEASEPPPIPAGLPSELIERRPDVAQAERDLAARNARIGVAQAAYFPDLTLTAFAGAESGDIDDLFDWSSRIWGLAPTLSVPIFKGGELDAERDRAIAVWEEGVANYRQQVLVAFKEVQDGLTATRRYAEQSAAQDRAVASARRARPVGHALRGRLRQLCRRDRRRAHGTAGRALRGTLARRGFVTAVQLVKALGGGWDPAQLPPLAQSSGNP